MWIANPFGVYRSTYEVEVECNRCGQDGLYWEETADGWRLFNEDGERHICKPSADDFECVGG